MTRTRDLSTDVQGNTAGLLDIPSTVAQIMDKQGPGHSLLFSSVLAVLPRPADAWRSCLGVAGSDLASNSIYAEVAAERPRTKCGSHVMEESGSDAANITFPSPPLVGPASALSLFPGRDCAGDGELDPDASYLSAYGKDLCLSVRAVKGEECPCQSFCLECFFISRLNSRTNDLPFDPTVVRHVQVVTTPDASCKPRSGRRILDFMLHRSAAAKLPLWLTAFSLSSVRSRSEFPRRRPGCLRQSGHSKWRMFFWRWR